MSFERDVLRFRTGNHVGRTIYLTGENGERTDSDVLCGLMDTTDLAEDAVRSMNTTARLAGLIEQAEDHTSAGDAKQLFTILADIVAVYREEMFGE
jgi:hypothetical protein